MKKDLLSSLWSVSSVRALQFNPSSISPKPFHLCKVQLHQHRCLPEEKGGSKEEGSEHSPPGDTTHSHQGQVATVLPSGMSFSNDHGCIQPSKEQAKSCEMTGIQESSKYSPK